MPIQKAFPRVPMLFIFNNSSYWSCARCSGFKLEIYGIVGANIWVMLGLGAFVQTKAMQQNFVLPFCPNNNEIFFDVYTCYNFTGGFVSPMAFNPNLAFPKSKRFSLHKCKLAVLLVPTVVNLVSGIGKWIRPGGPKNMIIIHSKLLGAPRTCN